MRRFAGGFFAGLASTFGLHADTLPQLSRLGEKGNGHAGRPPRKGGDNSSEHDRVSRDTKLKIQQLMSQYVDDGKVTIDCEPGGATANCIPRAHKSDNGRDGKADVILRGKDKETGKPVIYIWKVKPGTKYGRDLKTAEQIDRYVWEMQKEVDPGVDVRYGFSLPRSSAIPGSGNRVLSAWSRGDFRNPDNRWRGVRFYGGKEKRQKKTQPQGQEQEQPAETPGHQPATDCSPPMARMRSSCLYPTLPDGGGEGRRVPMPRGVPLPRLIPDLVW